MQDFIEMRILEGVRSLLSGVVNSILEETEFAVPVIEIGGSGSGVVSPVITLSTCERSEKERVLLLDAYALQIVFAFDDALESELFCYAYSSAVDMALRRDVTLGGVAERAVITGKKYLQPKAAHCGLGWSAVLTLRVTVQ